MLNTLATFRGVSVVLEWTYMSMKMVHHLVLEDLSFGIQYLEYTIHAEDPTQTEPRPQYQDAQDGD